MRILLVSPRGFCAGVRRAVDALHVAIDRFPPPIYVFNEIVHNRHVVAEFADRVRFVRDIDTVPAGATLMISAHGASPDVRQRAIRRGIQLLDATCPLVTRLHNDARRLAADGYHLLLIGHRGHDEVVGVVGEAPEAITVVQSSDEADAVVVPHPQRVAWITQTTLSVETVREMVERLRRRFPTMIGPQDGTAHAATGHLCYATQNRQEAIRRFTPQSERVVVVGSPNSSNSRRLAEIAADTGVPSLRIDDASELDPAWFFTEPGGTGASGVPVGTILLTAGASAPKRLVQECVAWFVDHFGATVELAVHREETTRFPLPKELRN